MILVIDGINIDGALIAICTRDGLTKMNLFFIFTVGLITNDWRLRPA